ncbi:MAG: hypothetical protein MRJ65_07640 [Candidatus Brocadiaceae bacterium]|nr:hypothetical protein [Candidatus Brocadiaceae bacterium]
MKKTALIFILVLSCLLTAVVVSITTTDMETCVIHKNIDRNFQQLVHGMGIGASAKPAWCYSNFDPRIDPRCACVEWPIPGGYPYCPDHTGTVSSLPSNLEIGVEIDIMKKSD